MKGKNIMLILCLDMMNKARLKLTTFAFGIQCSASWATHPLHLASHFYVNYTHSLHPVQVTTAIMCTLVSCHKKTKEKSWWLQSNALPLSYKRISSAQRESNTWPFECYSNCDNLNPNLMFNDQNQVHSLLYWNQKVLLKNIHNMQHTPRLIPLTPTDRLSKRATPSWREQVLNNTRSSEPTCIQP